MEEEIVLQSSYIASPISAQHVAFTSLFEYSFNRTLYKGGRASTSQINFSESNIVHKNLNAALGQPNETRECRLHNVMSACVDNAPFHVGIAWRWTNAKLKVSEALV